MTKMKEKMIMRKAERLDSFYNEMQYLHKKYLPDWRFLQMMLNYFSWHLNKYGNDGFYVEDAETIDRFREYMHEMVGYKWNEG